METLPDYEGEDPAIRKLKFGQYLGYDALLELTADDDGMHTPPEESEASDSN